MPINQLERHPYLNYREKLKEKNNDFTGLIIGTFPIFACTDLIDENLNVFKKNNCEEKLRFRFFYGSKQSEFWDYIFRIFNNSKELNIDNAIDLLERNQLMISDVIYQTNREDEKSEDKFLLRVKNVDNFTKNNISLNFTLKKVIEENKNIKNLFFTATGITGKSPFGLFKKIFGKDLKIGSIKKLNKTNWSLNCSINNRDFNVFLLPTPKPRGIHFSDNSKHGGFINYLKSVDINFYNEIESLFKINRTKKQEDKLIDYRYNFLLEIYRQAIIKNNINFNGTLEI